jgi:hypothetical protein
MSAVNRAKHTGFRKEFKLLAHSSVVKNFLLEILRGKEQHLQIKLLMDGSIIEGTFDFQRNQKLLSPPTNGFNEHNLEEQTIYLKDVAIRPLNNPEVHVGLNELQLFLECIQGIISPLPHH